MPTNNQEMLLQLIKEHWNKNPNVEFGQILDDLLATRKNKKKDLYYTTTAEWIHLLTDILSEPDVFTKDSLSYLRGERYKRYHENPDRFAEEPKSLFVNGEFNHSNYIGGDDIIHIFFNVIFAEGQIYGSTQVNSLNLSYEGSYMFNEEENIHVFMFNLYGIDVKSIREVIYSSVFKVHDANDRFQTAWFNGRIMTEDDYIFLLNAIQKSGFDFRIGDFTNTELNN